MAVVLFLTSFPLFIFIGLPLAVLAGALSFYPINNRPFSFFLEAVVTYLKSGKLYIWQREEEDVHTKAPVIESTSVFIPTNLKAAKKKASKSGVSSLARKLELQALQKSE